MDARLINEGMKKELKRRIQRIESKLEEARRVSRNGNIFEKIRAKSTISDLQKDLSKLTMFEQDFSKFYTETNDNSYELPVEVKSQIERLSKDLDSKEFSSLASMVNSVYRYENYTKNYREIKEMTQHLLENSGAIFKPGNLVYVEREGNYSANHLISELEKQKVEKLKYKYDKNSEKNKIKRENDDSSLYLTDPRSMKIDAMMKSTDKFDTKGMKTIKANYPEIRKNQVNQKKAEKILERVDTVISNITAEMKVSGVNFNEVITELQTIKNNAMITLKESEKYLAKFDLSIIDQELEQYEKKQDDMNKSNEYMKLLYDREKAIEEGNLAKANEITQSLKIAGSKYTEEQIMEMQSNVNHKLYDEKIVEKAKIKEQEKKKNMTFEERMMMEEGRKEQAFSERDKVIRDGEAHLKDLAMEKLINDGVKLQFDEEKDAYLIHKEIEKMKQIVGMTPSERAKADGVTNPNDIVFYSDEFMGFDVKDFKNTDKMLQDNMKAQATSIYKDYIRYYASQKDKKEAMKFSEFAARSYGYIDMNEQMVEDDVIKEGRSR